MLGRVKSAGAGMVALAQKYRAESQYVIAGPVPAIHDDLLQAPKVIMDYRNSGLSELRIKKFKSARADLNVSQRHPLALLAGRCGPVMTGEE